jgi:hypothetical protein
VADAVKNLRLGTPKKNWPHQNCEKVCQMNNMQDKLIVHIKVQYIYQICTIAIQIVENVKKSLKKNQNTTTI